MNCLIVPSEITNSSFFILGKCQCGCGADIPIRTNSKPRILQRFKRWHGGNLIKKGEHRGQEFQFQKDHGMNKGKDNPMFGKRAWNYKGRLIDSYGYILIYKPDHPFADNKGHIREHRLVMEKHLSRYLTSEEDIHHINGIKDDNRIENLQLMTNNKEHMQHHYPKGSKFGINQS